MRRVHVIRRVIDAVLLLTLLVVLGHKAPHSMVPACQYEDSTACHWDATHQGNGRGHSVTNP